MNLTVFFLFFSIQYLLAQDDDGILCTVKTCSDYIDTSPCNSLPTNCNIQNSTHNGIFLPSPDPCGCCRYCLSNLNEGDYCAMGETGGLVPETICGPGLYCYNGTCIKMTDMDEPPTSCTRAQKDYDQRRKNGVLGSMELRPNCDDDGFYQPYKCVPGQTCFCVDKEGNRLFGEIPFSSNAHLLLKCKCPRKYYDVLKFFDVENLHPNQHFRCADNGDYDTIQCIGDNCMCTDALDGAPTFPTRSSVNITNISNETLAECFIKELHLEKKYHYDCAEKYIKILNEINEYEDQRYDTVFNIEFPKCDLNGKYQTVQINQTEEDAYKYCANFDGTPIDDYRGTVDDTEMDCKCAKSSLLLSKNSSEKPDCCQNGNFNPVQCRRGKCYCVDSDGYQKVGEDVDSFETSVTEKDTLFCYDEVAQKSCHPE